MPAAVRTAVGGHPLVAETLVRRGITNSREARAFLDPAFYHPAPPSDLPQIVRAVERLEQAIELEERICIWGDFDVDGQTATTLLLSTLRHLGADAIFHIPSREKEGHGVNLPILNDIIDEGVGVVLTCDTGVTAHDAVAHAAKRGVDVIVTDHHDLPPGLPEAVAVVNPKMVPASHPLRELPGVGVAYKLAELLFDRAGRPRAALRHLDLVALGIVADVATQVNDVRYLLQIGLEALRSTERLGLRALMETIDLSPSRLTEEHIGFQLAPRINSLGRLADATPAIDFFTTQDPARARILAHELDALNARRKMLCDEVANGAQSQIDRDPSLLEQGALVLSHPSWPGGVIGIVAGRLAEKYRRPTILIAAPPGETARGSARSIEGCDISAAIAAHAELLEGFGGHPMAAGLAIDPERIPEFRRRVSRTVRQSCSEVLEAEPMLEIDAYIPLSNLSLDLVEELGRLAPFGSGNPPLTLATRGLSLKGHTALGTTEDHLKVLVEDEQGAAQEVLWWHATAAELPRGPFDLAYTVRASDYAGQRRVQVEWVDARSIEVPDRDVGKERLPIKVLDRRGESDPRTALDRLRAETSSIVWSEGMHEVAGVDRFTLSPARILVIWTTPPGGPELRAALAQVSPEVVHLFAVDPGLDQPESFLTNLALLSRRVIREEGGVARAVTLAAATAQREETVRAGLAWLEEKGIIVVVDERDNTLHLAPGDGSSGARLHSIGERVQALLEETKAYRAYVARADAESLITQAVAG